MEKIVKSSKFKRIKIFCEKPLDLGNYHRIFNEKVKSKTKKIKSEFIK